MSSPKQAPLTAKNLAWLVEKYSDDPCGFALEILQFPRLDAWQQWFLTASLTYGKGGKKLAIASAHSTGKTLCSGAVSLHRLLCFPQSHTLITSATESQLKAAFVGTINRIIEGSIIKDWFDVQAESVTVKGIPDSWIRFQAWSLNKRESFAGIHCTSPMLIADEASAIATEIFESWDGNMMHPNSLLVMLGNPLHRHGNLFDAFHGRKQFFETAHVSAKDSSFISDAWVEEMKAQYGEDSDVYRVRVLGLFPQADGGTFINDALLRKAVDRAVVAQHNEPKVAGIDIGQFKDQSVMTIRQGNKVLAIRKWNTRDSMIVAQEIHQEIVKHNVVLACIDGNGVGSGAADRLNQLCPGKVMRFKFANLPETEKQYSNTRSKYWGEAKKWLEYGSIPNDKDLINEGSSLLYSYDKYGRYQLESKELAAKRGVGSPDVFDSLAYSFAAKPDICGQNLKFDNNVSFNLF